ncbi:MAG: hypothetical protein AAFW81_00700 [Pseudomonadota bacterium]
MLLILASLLAASAGQATAPDAGGGAGDGAVATTPDLTAPPDFERGQRILCGCAKAQGPSFVVEGIVVDAELRLGPDGRSAADLQTTIFSLLSAPDEAGLDGERVRVLHDSRADKCGVRFDYGKRYSVPVRRTDEGALETGYCLMAGATGGAGATETETPAEGK